MGEAAAKVVARMSAAVDGVSIVERMEGMWVFSCRMSKVAHSTAHLYSTTASKRFNHAIETHKAATASTSPILGLSVA